MHSHCKRNHENKWSRYISIGVLELKEGKLTFMDSDSLAYALRSLFEHKGFWMEEENDG